MRITGGVLRGRLISVPRAGVRPTQDKVRAALFSILGPRVSGCRFLDLFAGSGSVGLEAWSRGADLVCWVESSRRVCHVLRRNIEALCDSRAMVSASDALRFLEKRLVDARFDIIFSDPPYSRGGKCGISGRIMKAIEVCGMLVPRGLVIIEHHSDEELLEHEGWIAVDDRAYGNTRLRFYKRTT